MNTAETDLICVSQSNPQQAALVALQQRLLAEANAETIPSGLLLTSHDRAEALAALNGSAEAPVLTQLEFEALFDTLQSSALQAEHPLGSRLPISGLVGAAPESNESTDRGDDPPMVPIVLADVRYQRLRKRWFAQLANLADDVDAARSAKPPALAEVVATNSAFFASLLLPADYELFARVNGKHYGQRIRLTLPQDGYRGNQARALTHIEIWLGEGEVLSLAPGAVVEHTFSQFGIQQVLLTAHFDQGPALQARFQFEVAASAPKPNETWQFAESNGLVGATAWVYYGRPPGTWRTKIEKPVLLAEGFPGGRTLDQLWPLVNQSYFVRELIGKGRDVVLLGFRDGTRTIQENAALYERCLKEIIAKKNNAEKIAAGGGSMGGLIARYALCKMEKAGFDHQCNRYFSVDTPHEGANIPVSVQAFVQLYSVKACGGRAQEPARLMASPGAQQMLLQWVPPYAQWENNRRYPLASPLRHAFLNDLREQGWMPQKLRRIGVADGVGTGIGNGVPAAAQALKFSLSVWHWADMWASAEGISKVVAMVNGSEFWAWQHGGQRIDGAPGGTRDTWDEAWRSLPSCTRYYGDHCFVPTTSACAIATTNYYLDQIGQRPSDLHAIKFSSTGNLPHVALTPELKTFLVDEIMKP